MKDYQSSHQKVQKRERTTSSTRHALNSNIHIFLYIELYVNSIGVSVSAAGYPKGFPSPIPRCYYCSRRRLYSPLPSRSANHGRSSSELPLRKTGTSFLQGHRVFTNLLIARLGLGSGPTKKPRVPTSSACRAARPPAPPPARPRTARASRWGARRAPAPSGSARGAATWCAGAARRRAP